tara:strand:+ start:32 stop:685 length:654 start_codon:yes stop_codon:yes gene_type:complete
MTDAKKNFSTIQLIFIQLGLLVFFIGTNQFLEIQWGKVFDSGQVSTREDRLPAQDPSPIVESPAALLAQMYDDPLSDVSEMVDVVVKSYENTAKGRVLASYLVWAISSAKPDGYIDTLLNSAAKNGDFHIPDALLTLSGRLDTPSLLKSVILAGGRAKPKETPRTQQHLLKLSDSLAGLSLTYYGNPQAHMRISNANEIMPRIAEAQVGQVVEIPGL